ncbi:MAG: diguanylate cyclase [Pseudomonadota bacterium]
MPLISFIRGLLCSALLLLAVPSAHGADMPGAYRFRSYGPDQGLRNQAVTGLAQDDEGFMFVATEDGLFRYDGNRFERFGTADGLRSDSILGLYREPRGRLWVMNAKGGIAWAGNHPDPSVKDPILPTRRIESMAAALSGYLVVATTEGIYEGPPEKLVPVAGLPRIETGAVWISTDGKEVLATAQGKLFQRLASGPWKERLLPAGAKNELIHTIIKDGAGRIWIRGRRVLLRLPSFDGALEDLSDKLPGASVQKGQLVIDPLGKVWAPTNLGLVRFDGASSWVMSEHQGLPTQWANSMLFDKEGNLWIASEGVHRLQGRLQWTAHTQAQKLPSDTVWNVFRTRDGVLWAGTNRGMAHSTEKAWVLLPGTEERSLYAFAEDAEGNFWAGGNNAKQAKNALLMRSAGSSAFVQVPLDHLEGPSTVNTMAFALDGALYIGTQAHGLHRVAREGAGYRGKPVALPKGEAKEQINHVLRDAKGRLWVAGMGGLAYFDGALWRRFGIADGLRELQVETLAIDPAGQLLVSYWNTHGLTRFKVNDTGLAGATQITEPAALIDDNIYSLGYDVHGALWLGTAQGVKRWKDGRLDQYGRGEGLPSEDAAAIAFWADPNGDVWIGMATGLAHYHAAAELPPPLPPATRVLRVQDGAANILTAPVPEVAWNKRTLTFRFAVLGYTNENKIRAQVRLVGFEDTWRDTDIREARYTGLPPGRYRFEARAALGLDQFGAASTRDVVILAPWWLTGWSLMLYLLVLGVGIFLFLRWRLGRLHRRNVELETLVRARTEALEQANGALHESSMIDPLTGLKNRRFLGLTMPDELARVNRQFNSRFSERMGDNNTLLFFMVDLDHFKAVNDTYGHAAGDLVLQQASAALRKACRDADFVVRWGGEEFLIVARNADRSCANILANNLRDAVRELRIDVGNGVVLQKTCSVGFAAFPVIEAAPEAHPWEDVVKMADQCLYAAKLSGRDAWVGLALPPGAADPGPRLASELGALVSEGLVEVHSSLPAGTPYRWQ